MDEIRDVWIGLFSENENSNGMINKFWLEVFEAYSAKERHYHDISHIDQMLKTCQKYSSKILDLRNIQMSIFYHDVVYSAKKNDNEERSAEFAREQLTQLNFNNSEIDKCCNYILATKGHLTSNQDNDLNFFLDFDLEKLGSDWAEYIEYTKQIREEYRFYPKLVYNPGRKKVLQHFLGMVRIYKTDEFYNLYEQQARDNMLREISTL